MSRQDQSTLPTKTVTEIVDNVAIDSAAVDTANQVAVATEGRLSEATHVVQAPIRGFSRSLSRRTQSQWPEKQPQLQLTSRFVTSHTRQLEMSQVLKEYPARNSNI